MIRGRSAPRGSTSVQDGAMNQQRRRRKRERSVVRQGVRIALPTAAALGVTGALATAATSTTPPPPITACYPTSGPDRGQLRLASTCRVGERAIRWAAQGP